MGHRASVRTYLAVQVRAVQGGDVLLRADAPDAVHDTRVAVRRLRSVLRVFPALEAAAPAGVEELLRGWSDQLGAVRDLETMSALLAEVCPPPLWARLRPQLEQEASAATAAMMAAMQSLEHRQLLEDIEALVLAEPGRLGARRRVRRAARKARARLREADGDPDLLHRARRAAKRARDAAEAIGDKGEARQWQAVQQRLGTHHDCVVALARLDRVRSAGVAEARAVLRGRMRAASGESSGAAGSSSGAAAASAARSEG